MRAGVAIFAVAHNTFREAIRDKVLYGIVFFGVLGLAGTYVLSELASYESARVVRDLALAGSNLLAILVAIVLGVTLLHKEVDRRTAYAILPKPLHRWQFVIGKFCGMAATLIALCVLLAGVVEALLRTQASTIDGPTAVALVLSLLEVLVVTAVAVTLSCWTRPFLSGLLTAGIFILGRSAEEIGALAARAEGPMRLVFDALHKGLPNLYLFQVSGWEVAGKRVSIHGTFVDWAYVASAATYAGLCIVGALAIAVLLFRRRDFA